MRGTGLRRRIRLARQEQTRGHLGGLIARTPMLAQPDTIAFCLPRQPGTSVPCFFPDT